jgi:3-oxoacyl-[acyl-carrier protein] reductase
MQDHPMDSPVGAAPPRRRVALVSGGSRNLGRAVAHRLARSGLAVAVGGRSPAEVDAAVAEIVAAGGSAVPAVGDVADETDVARMVEGVRDAVGPVTVLVHCAAYRSPHRGLRELATADWSRNLAVALDGAFLTTRALLPDMCAARYGRVILIGGPSAYLGLPLGSVHGATGKAGMSGFAASLAQEYGSLGITANVLAPGTMATALNAGIGSSPGWNPVATSATGQAVYPDDVADLVDYLASEAAASVTGQTIRIDGGMVARRSAVSRAADESSLGGTP